MGLNCGDFPNVIACCHAKKISKTSTSVPCLFYVSTIAVPFKTASLFVGFQVKITKAHEKM